MGRRMTTKRWTPSRPASAPSRRSDSGLIAAAPEHPGEAGDAAADHEPGDRGTDEDLLLVRADLLAPVGELGDLVAQALDGLAELDAVGLDRRADLFRRAGAGAQLVVLSS